MKLEDGIGEKVVQFTHIVATCFGCLILAVTVGWHLAPVCLASLLATMVTVVIVTVVSIHSIQELMFKPSPCKILIGDFFYIPSLDFFLNNHSLSKRNQQT
jgi:hypothetical protein